MNLIAKWAVISGTGLATLSLVAGCKVSDCTETTPDGGTTTTENCVKLEPTIEYRDARLRVGGSAWRPGSSVRIVNRNGSLKVALGGAGDERVQFSGVAFTRGANNPTAEQNAKAQLGQMPDPTIAVDGVGDFIVDAPGGGSNGFEGYDLTVWVPIDFDANLIITNQNGTLTLYGAEGTKSTDVTSHEIVADNLHNSIRLNSTVGDISVSNASRLSGVGNVIHTAVGDVNISVGASDIAVSAKSDLGVVAFGGPWTSPVVADDKRSGTATLGAGTSPLTVTTGNGDIGLTAQ